MCWSSQIEQTVRTSRRPTWLCVTQEDALKDRVDIERPLDGSTEEPFLGAKVVHDQSRIDAARSGHRPDAGLIVPTDSEQTPGGIQDQALGVALARAAASTSVCSALLPSPLPSRLCSRQAAALACRACQRRIADMHAGDHDK